ncbi:MAG: BamA/TamA family outer membrane protein [Acidobacteriaceae bacterium]|nr:BamA/TamA family outer membrane protein [Acidobacteriaceae bacterium]
MVATVRSITLRSLPLFVLTLGPITLGIANAADNDLLDQALQYDGQTIGSIEFEPQPQPLENSELLTYLPFQKGSIFHARDLPAAIQALFSSGRFSNISVDGRTNNGQLQLRFLTDSAYFVGHVWISGIKAPPNAGQLSGAARLNLGSRYLDSERQSAASAMTGLLRENGLYQSQIESKVTYDPYTQQTSIAFQIEPGKRAHFSQPIITGDAERTTQLIRATHWQRLYGLRGWHEFTAVRLEQGLTSLRKYYAKRDFVRADVRLNQVTYSQNTNSVTPHLTVTPGPQTVVTLQGARLSRRKLHELIPIYQERTIDPELVAQGQRNLENYFQSFGYFHAQVKSETGTDSATSVHAIVYHVTRGNRYKVVVLKIDGNRFFPEGAIRERLSTVPAQWPRFPVGHFSDQTLQADLQAIEQLYMSNGFRNVKVTSRVLDDFGGRQHNLGIFFHIEEGPQARVAALTIRGVSDRDRNVLSSILSATPGQAFSETTVASDRDNILNYFYSRGYLNANFEYSGIAESRPTEVILTYDISPGPQAYVRNVLVSGLETTRSRLVYDRINLQPNQPLSLSDEIASQRRLYDLGVFARVNTALQNAAGDEKDKNVLFDIDEARHYAVNFGIGAQIARIGGGVTTLDNPAGTTGFAPRIALGITRENLLGLGQTLGLQGSLSTIRQRAALTYFIPQFVSNENLSLTTTVLIDYSNDIRTFSARRREASVQLGQRLSRAYTLQYRLVFRNVTESNLKINQLLVPLLAQPETVGLGELSFIQDKRDDPTDAHHGIYTTADLSYAPSALGSQTEFGRALLRNSTYHELKREIVLARSTQFGVMARTGGRPAIPLPERIYSGGSTSIRAFPDFQAGPRDLVTGFPLGGQALFINNTELRFPLYGDNLGGVLFHDAGNVYSSVEDMSFRFRQSNLQDFNYLVQNVGLGVRYRTPIGPLRVDLSFSPDAPRFYGLKGTLQDYLNGTAVAQVQKINAFQFHISLGQAF